MSKLTVLIPGRNVERTLAETLDSLLAQTWQDFQVLLVDDASSDGTADIARAYSSRLRLEVLSLPENAGVAGALNAGLQQITTPYIARIDADDIALPTRLEHQVGFLEANPGIDVCSSWMEIFYEQPGRAPHVLAKPLNDALIKTALAHTGGRRVEAAHLLGLGRNTLTRKIQELGIDGGRDDEAGV